MTAMETYRPRHRIGRDFGNLELYKIREDAEAKAEELRQAGYPEAKAVSTNNAPFGGLNKFFVRAYRDPVKGSYCLIREAPPLPTYLDLMNRVMSNTEKYMTYPDETWGNFVGLAYERQDGPFKSVWYTTDVDVAQDWLRSQDADGDVKPTFNLWTTEHVYYLPDDPMGTEWIEYAHRNPGLHIN